MYVGHAAIATLTKAIRPRLALALLIPVAYGPDWVEWIADAFGHPDRAISHSLVSVAIGAVVVAGGYWLATRAWREAAALGLLYASHWAADFITGLKPTWPGGPYVGLMLYNHPAGDAVLESLVVLICWAVYWRSLPPEARRWVIGVLAPVGLVGLQLLFDAIQSPGWFK